MNCNAVGPGDFATIYSVEKLWNPGISGTKIDGNGQTIAIVGDSEICTANSPDFGTSYIGPNGTTVTCSSDDVALFRSQFGLPAKSPNVILDGPDPGFNGDETEGDLDVEWSGAVAKNATIDFVIAEDTEATFGTDLAAEYVVDNNLAPILSESFGECEQSLGNDGNAFEYVLWEQAAAQGITVVVSAGDSGSAGCDDPNLPAPNPAQYGPAVNGIASTPFNVAAGGTDFDTTVANYQTTYWGGTNTTDANGIKEISATSYIPETTWNDSCAQNFTGAITGCAPGNGGIVAGGGGQSNCEAQDTQSCYYYAKPSWQTVASGSGLTVATDVTRDLPDVSLFAADGFKSNSFYIICESDLDPGGAACNLSTPYFDFVGVGGTSSAAPTFAGIMALVNQNMAVNHPGLTTRQGNANYILYHLAANQSGLNCNSSSSSLNSACTFNDITKGNNSVPCLGGTFSCSNSSKASGAYGVEEAFSFSTGLITNNLAWNTATGLDLATGLGSINALNLATNWATAVGAFTSTTPTLCLSTTTPNLAATCSGPITITHGQTVYVNVTVNGTVSGTAIPVSDNQNSTPPINEDVSLIGTFPGGNPSCSVTGCNTGGVDRFLSYNYVVNNADIYPLTNGTTVGQNFGTSSLVGGTYNVTAHYAGDGTYGASDSANPISVTVNPETSGAFVSVQSYDPAGNQISSPVPYGDFSLVRVDVVGNSSGQESATGIVTLKDNDGLIVGPTGTLTSQFNLNTEGYLEDQTPYLAVGAHSFVATFGGDASYSASAASAAVALTVVQAPVTTVVTASAMTISSGQNVTLTATVNTTSQGNPPTGTVQFLVGGAPFGAPVTVTGSLNPNTFYAQAVAVKMTTTLPTGQDSITAQYSGDTNYMAGSASAAIVESVGSAGINLLPAAGTATLTVSSPGSLSSTQLVTVTGSSGFAGTVTLSAAVTGPSGAVDSPTCSFGAPDTNFTAPSTITLSAASETGTATMSCTTTAASQIVFRPSSRPSGRAWPLAGVAVSLACLFFMLAVPRHRRLRLVPLAVLFVVIAAAGVSCGGGSSSGGGGGITNPGTTLGNYTVTVTATPQTGTAQTTTITVNVQ